MRPRPHSTRHAPADRGRRQAERNERTARLVEEMATSLDAMRLRQEETDKKLAKLLPEAASAPVSTARRGLEASSG